VDSSQSPAPEALQPQADKTTDTPETGAAQSVVKPVLKPRRGAYRPSHKATFIGLVVVVAILAVNAGIIAFVISKAQSKDKALSQAQVIISQSVLSKLGVSQTPVGDQGIQLQVNPDAKFGGKVQVAGDVNIAGQLNLNNAFTAPGGKFGTLQAGNTSLSGLDVNGNGTFTNLSVRSELDVAGITRLQGNLTVSNLLTVNNGMNVTGSLSVGGVLSTNTLHLSALVVDTSATIGGHIITRGTAPAVSPGGALGSNGTVSISGNDQAGTVAVNIGVGAASGTVANVTFHLAYSSTPHVLVTAIGRGNGDFYINRSAAGFSIGVNTALPPGGYAFDFLVAQ
jgi:hypothetical protein